MALLQISEIIPIVRTNQFYLRSQHFYLGRKF
jgi:hypothetical protein